MHSYLISDAALFEHLNVLNSQLVESFSGSQVTDDVLSTVWQPLKVRMLFKMVIILSAESLIVTVTDCGDHVYPRKSSVVV